MIDNIQYDPPMNGAEIAREMNISRQAVSYAIRKSMSKMYKYVIDQNIADTPFTAVLALMVILGVSNSNDTDIQQFLKLFDKEIQDEVIKEAKNTYNIRD